MIRCKMICARGLFGSRIDPSPAALVSRTALADEEVDVQHPIAEPAPWDLPQWWGVVRDADGEPVTYEQYLEEQAELAEEHALLDQAQDDATAAGPTVLGRVVGGMARSLSRARHGCDITSGPNVEVDVEPLAADLLTIEAIALARTFLDSVELDTLARLHASAAGMLSTRALARAGGGVPVAATEVVAEEVVLATGVARSRVVAATRLAVSGARGRWLREQVEQGAVPADRAARAFHETRALADDDADAVHQDVFAPRADGAAQGWNGFLDRLEKAVANADPEAAHAKRVRARSARGVARWGPGAARRGQREPDRRQRGEQDPGCLAGGGPCCTRCSGRR